MRIGKPVTQEEIAESAGISRQWYGMLENDRRLHVSPRVLTRLADVLMMTPTERVALFGLAVPGLDSGVLQPCASPLEAFSLLRTYSRRLWAASSEREVLEITSDEIFTRFERPPLISMALRQADGSWDWPFIGGEPAVTNRFVEFIDMLRGVLNADEIDELHIYPLLSQPGEVCTDAVFPSLSIFEKLRRAQDAYRFGDWSLLYGRICARARFVAGSVVRIPKHEYSAEQRAILSTITLLTSLTLS
jgi:transcriptional regulator with XRE-family HTH domain